MEEYDKAMQRAVKLLTVRAHSTAELREKLFKKEFSAPAVYFSLNECKRLGYLNDRLFTEQYLSEMRGRGWGDRKCRMGLQKKGIDRATIDEVISANENPAEARERAAAVLSRKWQSLQRESDPRKRQEKAFRFMVSRGFPTDLVMQLLREFSRGQESGE